MHDSSTLATAEDISVSVDGTVTNLINITSLDATAGIIQIQNPGEMIYVDYITITEQMYNEQALSLTHIPLQPSDVIFEISGAPPQMYGADFAVRNNGIYWFSDIPEVGDIARIIYPSYLLSGHTISFTYLIKNTNIVSTVDPLKSRIYDYDDVYPEFSDDIAVLYLNKDTTQLSRYSFVGPEIVTYTPLADQTGPASSFPGAQIFIPYALRNVSPSVLLSDSTFLSDASVIMRQKTFYEITDQSTSQKFIINEVLPL
jgi:hypothetical protein